MFKIILKTGLVTALVIVIYMVANQLLVYKYLRLDYYLSATALIALVTGIMIARRSTTNQTEPTDNPCAMLTNKELQILSLISDGKSNKEIAALNFVELSTIKTHINNLYAKLGVSNRKAAVQIYHQYIKSTFSPPQIV